MERPTCKTCPYWKGYSRKTEADQDAGLFDNVNLGDALRGHCQFNPPTCFVDAASDTDEYEAVFPLTWFDASCGKHPDFKAYLASLKKPRTVPQMEAEIIKLEEELSEVVYEDYKKLGLHDPHPGLS